MVESIIPYTRMGSRGEIDISSGHFARPFRFSPILPTPTTNTEVPVIFTDQQWLTIGGFEHSFGPEESTL